jgi:hypothetical protein
VLLVITPPAEQLLAAQPGYARYLSTTAKLGPDV